MLITDVKYFENAVKFEILNPLPNLVDCQKRTTRKLWVPGKGLSFAPSFPWHAMPLSSHWNPWISVKSTWNLHCKPWSPLIWVVYKWISLKSWRSRAFLYFGNKPKLQLASNRASRVSPRRESLDASDFTAFGLSHLISVFGLTACWYLQLWIAYISPYDPCRWEGHVPLLHAASATAAVWPGHGEGAAAGRL